MPTQGYCPQCKVNPTTRTARFGTFPRCDQCLEKNKIGRYQRRNEKVRAGRSCHRNSKGVRYQEHAKEVKVECWVCKGEFSRSSRIRGRYTCPKCKPVAKESRRVKNLKRSTDLYWKDPVAVKRRRLALILKRAGLSLEWYDSQPLCCGICGTTKPGKKGWVIDHDHSCCPPGVRQGCSKCIRGLLCSSCNTGLGQFKDNIDNLQRAIEWVKRGGGNPPPLPEVTAYVPSGP